MRNNPHLYEINLATWLAELSLKEKREMSLDTIPLEELSGLKSMGMDALWLMGVWQRSPFSTEKARETESIIEECRKILPDFDIKDIGGSPYAVRSYIPEAKFGSFYDLDQLRANLNGKGMALILDLVPNHLACDHPWVSEHPNRFISVPVGEEERCENDFFLSHSPDNKLCIAHGRDPYFPPWTDTAQLNYAEPETRDSMIRALSEIAVHCDGLRCDMAMLLLKDVFKGTWKNFLRGRQDWDEFWPRAIDSLRKRAPVFYLMGEVYWGRGKDLLNAGFDYVYDKEFYDLLIDGNVNGLRTHLGMPSADQERMVRFIENHDEPRAMQAFGRNKIFSTMVIHSTVPGMKLWYHGQFHGKKIRIPVQLNRPPDEIYDEDVLSFSQRLLSHVDHPVFHEGIWEVCGIDGWLDNHTCENILAWSWFLGDERRLVVVNFSSTPSQGRINPSSRWSQGLESARFHDPLKEEVYDRTREELGKNGLYVALDSWDFHFFRVEQNS